MKIPIILSILSAMSIVSCTTNKITYPETKRVSVEDDYHGTLVKDPYRWLENDTAKEVGTWVDAQNEVTQAHLNGIPNKEHINTRLQEIYNYEKYSSPTKAGDYYLFYKNDGLQNQSVLYIQKGIDGTPEVFLDPNTLSEDGTVTAALVAISKDDTYASIAINKSGSDWTEFKVMDLATKETLSDHVKWAKFTGTSWYKDGFYYSSYGIPEEGLEYSSKNEFHKVYYHKLGTDQSEDKLVFIDKEHALRNFFGSVTKNGDYLIVGGSEGTYGQEIFYKNLKADKDFTLLFPGFDYEYTILDYLDGSFLVYTNHGADNFHLVRVNPKNPKHDNWEIIIAEKDQALTNVSMAGGKLFASYLKDVTTQILQYDGKGNLEHEVVLPDLGTAGGFRGKPEDTKVFYTFASYLFPPTIMEYDIDSNISRVFKKSEVAVDLDSFVTERVFCKSKDGTQIPMFITHKKGMVMDGNNPTILYAYGGFSINILPQFKPDMMWLLEQGGIYAVANLRGGTEYGEQWHKAGMLHNKQNVFDDFIAAGEYLIKEKYTSKEKLAISGRSNGGLLVGACMTQRPDLYAVAFPAVGVQDMLRYHKFTIGWAWASEYGSSEEKEHFENLITFSPLHNVKTATDYPATMITTADHDDRVVPAHSFKFAAELQFKNEGCNPMLIRIDKKAGHGAGKPISKVIEENADIFAFMFHNMGLSIK